MQRDNEGEAGEPERKKTKRGGKSHQRKLRREERIRAELEARNQQSDEEELEVARADPVRRVYLEGGEPEDEEGRFVAAKPAKLLVPKASLRERHSGAPAEEETVSEKTLQKIQGFGLKAPPAKPPQISLPATAPVEYSAGSSSSSSSTYRPPVPPTPPSLPPPAPPTAALNQWGLPGKLGPPGIKQHPPPDVEPKEEVAEDDLKEEQELEIVGKQKTPKYRELPPHLKHQIQSVAIREYTPAAAKRKEDERKRRYAHTLSAVEEEAAEPDNSAKRPPGFPAFGPPRPAPAPAPSTPKVEEEEPSTGAARKDLGHCFLAIDVHNVLDCSYGQKTTDGSFPREHIPVVAGFIRRGGRVIVLTFIGRNSTELQNETLEKYNDFVQSLKEQYPGAEDGIQFAIVYNKTGEYGKCGYCEEIGCRAIIDDSPAICGEFDSWAHEGYLSYRIKAGNKPHQRHPRGKKTYNDLSQAVEAYIRDILGPA